MLKETPPLLTIMKHLLPGKNDFSAKNLVVAITTQSIKADSVMKLHTNWRNKKMPSRIDLKNIRTVLEKYLVFFFFPKWHDFQHSYVSCQNASNFLSFFQLADILGEKTVNFLYLSRMGRQWSILRLSTLISYKEVEEMAELPRRIQFASSSTFINTHETVPSISKPQNFG